MQVGWAITTCVLGVLFRPFGNMAGRFLSAHISAVTHHLRPSHKAACFPSEGHCREGIGTRSLSARLDALSSCDKHHSKTGGPGPDMSVRHRCRESSSSGRRASRQGRAAISSAEARMKQALGSPAHSAHVRKEGRG